MYVYICIYIYIHTLLSGNDIWLPIEHWQGQCVFLSRQNNNDLGNISIDFQVKDNRFFYFRRQRKQVVIIEILFVFFPVFDNTCACRWYGMTRTIRAMKLYRLVERKCQMKIGSLISTRLSTDRKIKIEIYSKWEIRNTKYLSTDLFRNRVYTYLQRNIFVS